jgi:uncharacterized protein
MKFVLDENHTGNFVQSYSTDKIIVNGKEYINSLVLMPNMIIQNWSSGTFEDLTRDDFIQIIKHTPEIVIFGTGSIHRFPPHEILQPLYDNSVGVETMNTAAACRTYNILMSEGKNVAAALLMI